jgi:hypothetical protein
MSQFTLQPAITLFLGLGFILLVICGIITATIRKSFGIYKLNIPKLKLMFAVAFLQILLGVMTVFIVKGIKNDPFIAIGTGWGMTILSGLFFLKLILKNSWRQSLGVWALASAMQLVLVPICSAVLLVGWVMLLIWLYPPQF